MDFEDYINDLAFFMDVTCHFNTINDEPNDYVKPRTDVLQYEGF
jgi:hypothetical protein